jgi:septum formation protein
MLEDAGVQHEVVPANIDETAIKAGAEDAVTAAARLAQAKALAVSADRRNDWVIGSDSIVAVEGRRFSKPANRGEGARHLRLFSGKTMLLTSAVALAHGERIDWTHVETAELDVRELSDEFIESYLDAEWPAVGYCVGVFRMEGRGAQLFDQVRGSHFTVLGMPLLPLLGALRERGVLLS